MIFMPEYTRIAIIDKDKCQPKSCNFLCQRSCPVVRMGQDAIVVVKENVPPIINEELCTGCGICPNKCPFKAINIINTGIKMGSPLHQYGKNSFRLYSIPFLEKGVITGIIGQNGAGKSTSLNILSGVLVPNLGNYNEKGDIDKVIEYFRGKELQKHFIDLKNKSVNIAYKVQKIEDIPLVFHDKIIDLLSKVNSSKQDLEKIVSELDLKDILYKTPSEVSGGELQRVAIGATLLKDANLYFFDEFSTFLDIKQRFKIANLLREKVNPNNSILFIEHDLALLDYISDYVYILFGKKQAYGVSSNRKTTKLGVNQFLEGFLKEENIRIRNYEISFVNPQTDKFLSKTPLVSYPFLEKTIGSFNLKVQGGTINKGEIIGILGANAIGKSTFIKMLAGEIFPDNLSLDISLKVGYKPQYINYSQDIFVSELFSGNDIDTDVFNTYIKKQLSLEEIFDKKISEISGGELQKVAIAHTLSKNVDIFLIDEPSAFLDIEQRLLLANIIKTIVSVKGVPAFIVDHDLLFVNYVSDRILLFKGEPGKQGFANKIDSIENGFNDFLKEQNMTFRQDQYTKRPRANKIGSQKDQEQRVQGKYYFTI